MIFSPSCSAENPWLEPGADLTVVADAGLMVANGNVTRRQIKRLNSSAALADELDGGSWQLDATHQKVT
jgi:hypothetical protein